MQIIYEQNIEREDFLEIIINEREFKGLQEKGVVMNFPNGLFGLRNLNVYLRIANHEDVDMPLVKGKKASSKEGFSENVKAEKKAGKPTKQAVAIAYSEARQGKKKAAKRGK